MNKKEFEKLDCDTQIFCRSCEKTMPISNFSYSNIKMNKTASRCKYCDWIYRHDGLPSIDKYNDTVISKTLKFILFNKSVYINDLSHEIGLNIDDSIDLLKILKIGNKKMLVKTKCKNCGKLIERSMSACQIGNNSYCCYSCYWEDKPNVVGHGKDNRDYKRIKTTCTNCGREIEVIPFDYEKTNSFGHNHNFCSQKCYWKYRSKYYVGEKSGKFGKPISEDQRSKMRLTILKNSRSGKRFDSGIQLKINKLLDDNNIDYEREYIIKYYAVDNYLTDSGLIIEVMGDYWHTSPIRYNENKYKINGVQQKGLLHDKQKHTYIKNHRNIEILYLWEHDIDTNIKMCEKLIFEYITQNGVLDNYHSFNWNYENDKLSLNDKIIIPYQDVSSTSYAHLLKKQVS